MTIYRNVLEVIGNTPLVELQRIPGELGIRILVKLEMLNPGGSIKSKTAYGMIRDAQKRGLLKPDSIIVEATSGNQGIALSMVGAILGYKVRVLMPENMSEERRALLKAYGAEVVITPAKGDIGLTLWNAINMARRMAEEDDRVFLAEQFENLANPKAQEDTTGKEILHQMGSTPVDCFVSGVGTGGTLTGVGRVLKGAYPDVKIVAAEPENGSVLLGCGKVGFHKQQGIGDGFIPPILDTSLIDQVVVVSDEEALAVARRLAREEGILAGISSGTNVAAALSLAKDLGPGKTIVTICPDTGERYLAEGLYNY